MAISYSSAACSRQPRQIRSPRVTLILMKSTVVLALSCAMLIGTAACAVAADKYPSRPVRMVVPYPPGGGSDITGRAIGAKLNEYLGQTFVIDNRPGATGLIGTELAAKAPGDGYTILLAD